jgi:hypothetical protein
MLLHFQNPVMLIIARAILGEDFECAEFVVVNPNHRDTRRNSMSYVDESFRLRYSLKIATILKVKLRVISWNEFINSEKYLLDSNLLSSQFKFNGNLILHSSDTYCLFGFKSYFPYPVAKIRLYRYWNSMIKSLNHDEIFIYGRSEKFPFSFKQIDLDAMQKILTTISSEIFQSKQNEIRILPNSILILPPIREQVGFRFHSEFFKQAENFLKNSNLRAIIKPHRKDFLDYENFLKGNLEFYNDYELCRWIPVEFFLHHNDIVSCISSPSSALAVVDRSKLLVLIPSESKLFRLKFLDQIPFLEQNEIPFKVI